MVYRQRQQKADVEDQGILLSRPQLDDIPAAGDPKS